MQKVWCGGHTHTSNTFNSIDSYFISRNREKSSARQFHLVHLNIRDGRPESTAPVDQTIASVDCPVLVHPDKGLGDGLAALGVHGEGASVPVHGAAQLSQLIIDGVTCQYNCQLFDEDLI